MSTSELFLESPDNTRDEIMRATYLALGGHGYADLTIDRIGEEFGKSKSLIYHHYDSKDELLLDFLQFMLERFKRSMPFENTNGAYEHLQAVLNHVLATPLAEDRREFGKAMVELRVQAAHDERYRDHFTEHDRVFREHLAAIIEAGIDEGVFDPVDADATAAVLLTIIVGSMTQRVTSAHDSTTAVREQVENWIRATLLKDA